MHVSFAFKYPVFQKAKYILQETFHTDLLFKSSQCLLQNNRDNQEDLKYNIIYATFKWFRSCIKHICIYEFAKIWYSLHLAYSKMLKNNIIVCLKFRFLLTVWTTNFVRILSVWRRFEPIEVWDITGGKFILFLWFFFIIFSLLFHSTVEYLCTLFTLLMINFTIFRLKR